MNPDTGRLSVGWYGFYDDPTQTTPVHDPGDSAPCLLCFTPWTDETVRTISLMPLSRVGSYFYRVHRACHERWMAEHPDKEEPPSAWLMDLLDGPAQPVAQPPPEKQT